MVADQQQQWEQLAERVSAELREVWEAATETKSAEELEQAVLEWRGRVGRVVMEAVCQAVVRERERRQVQVCCGERMDHHSQRGKSVLTLLGAVRVKRRYWRCLRCGRGALPGDAWLGWSRGFSWHLEEAVAWECSVVPYREALESLSKLAGVELSVLGAEQIVARWGKQKTPVEPYAERVQGDLILQIDGAITPFKEGWKEAKLACCFDWDRLAPREQQRPQAVSYVADWKTAEEFRETLWEEALARGVTTARTLAVLGDGAAWIWDTVDHLFPYAVQILDWYHLTEHLWEAGKAISGEGKPGTRELVEYWKTEVWEGRSEVVEEHLREYVATGHDDSDHTLRRCADYLQTHQHRLRYHHFRAMGLPTGSGVVEGACSHVLGLRFKRKSTRWTKPGARAVLHLRLDRINGRWDRRCQLTRQAA